MPSLPPRACSNLSQPVPAHFPPWFCPFWIWVYIFTLVASFLLSLLHIRIDTYWHFFFISSLLKFEKSCQHHHKRASFVRDFFLQPINNTIKWNFFSPLCFLFALLRFVFVLLCFVFVLMCFVFVRLYFVFAALTICICSSCACLHQIFPNASDQISLALFCTFREREGAGGAGCLPLCGLGNTRMRSQPHFPSWCLSHPPPPPISSFIQRRQNRITEGSVFALCGNLWRFNPRKRFICRPSSRIKASTQPSIEMSKAQQTPDFDARVPFECRSCVCCFRNTFLFPPFSNLQ